MIRKMKLFPKTFFYTLLMLLVIVLSMHLMIYFFYPKVYISRMQSNLEQKLQVLQQSIQTDTEDDRKQDFSDFAKENNVNVTVNDAGQETTYRGMNFEISLYGNKDAVFSVNNLQNAQSIIVKNKTMQTKEGNTLSIKLVASAMPVKEAVDMITFLLPCTFAATIVFSVIFSYFYSKRITNPILKMLDITKDMKNLKPDATFLVSTEDEMGELAEQINEVYACLLSTIQSLDAEKEHMVEVEKAKTVFLRSASHELKTPLAGLRILLENMQYNVGKYKDHDTYLAQAVATVDNLSAMVKDILDTSKAQEAADGKKETLFLKKEIERILHSYEVQITEKKLDVSIELSDMDSIVMQVASFEKIWSNLIANAVKYTYVGGKIQIGADPQKLWIENTCTPLHEEVLSYIYEPFYRPDNMRNQVEGNGLGLYVVSELLKKEGFSYSFEPVEEAMCFYIYR